MTHFLILLFWFTPAFVANGMPVIVKNIYPFSLWNTPISEKYLGSHKTWRGIVMGVGFAGIIAGVQFYFFPQYFPFFSSFFSAFLGGMFLGFGALMGDIVESFIKRKIGKRPGEALFFWDGVDYIIGSMLCMMFFTPLFVEDVLFLLLLAPLLSLFSNSVAYVLGWKSVWY